MTGKLTIETRVRTLKSYLNDIEKGIIQIPTFQRDFVWTRDNIKELFDSIKNRYPIGSIMLWKPENPIGENKERIGSYYVPKNSDSIYILDGFQRLSTLFGCLTNPNKTPLRHDYKEWENSFSLYYDLEEETFLYLRSKVTGRAWQIPVYVLMNSSDFRQYARKEFETIQDESQIELYYDRADVLSRTLLEYQIASIDIREATIEEAVEVFSRINSKGETISLDWMANALSTKDGFRFADEIDNLLDELRPYNFDKINRNAIFRCVQSSFNDKLYIDNSKIDILAKRDDFSKVTKKTLPYIKKGIQFLFEELLVLDSKLLPYNIQLIYITDFFKHIKEPTKKQIDDLKKWFWITTYSNYFTLYSLANQRKAYYHFKKYLKGEELTPIFNDTPTLKFSTADFPEKITMGSVRSKALTLFLLNYSNDFDSVSSENAEGYMLQKLFSEFGNNTENIIPVVLSENNPIKNKIKKLKDFSYLLGGLLHFEDSNKHFITKEMKEMPYQSRDDKKTITNERKKHIQNKEKQFVEKLGLEYY